MNEELARRKKVVKVKNQKVPLVKTWRCCST